MSVALYEILVPTVSNDGKPFRKRHHRVFDDYVLRVAGGVTIGSPNISGKWLDSRDGTVYQDRTIPVRIACTAEQIDLVADFIAKHYDQKAVAFWKISDEVHIKQYGPVGPS